MSDGQQVTRPALAVPGIQRNGPQVLAENKFDQGAFIVNSRYTVIILDSNVLCRSETVNEPAYTLYPGGCNRLRKVPEGLEGSCTENNILADFPQVADAL